MLNKIFITISGAIWVLILANPFALSEKASDVLIIQNVNIVDTSKEKVLREQDILVLGSKILEIDQNIEVPENAKTRDFSDHYVIPALFDMHAHINTEMPWHEYHLALYRYFGIHTVNFTAGSDELKELKMSNEKNVSDFLSPEIYLASELIDGDPPLWGDNHDGPIITDTEEVEPTLLDLKEKGYHDIKVYNQLQEEVYLEILETSEKLDLRVVGHIPYSLSLDKRLDSRHQRIDHLEGYLGLAYEGKLEVLQTPGMQRTHLLADGFNEDKMNEAARKTAERGIWNCPTHALFSSLTDSSYVDEIMNGEFSQLLDPQTNGIWSGVINNEKSMPHLRSEKYRDIHREMISILHDNGAKLLAGTDAPQPVLLYGHSLHKELQYFVEAGMNPFEALETATVNPAEYLGLDQQGKITEGYKAEMIILEDNPIADIKNTLSIKGYVSGNHYLSEKEMKSSLLGFLNKQ